MTDPEPRQDAAALDGVRILDLSRILAAPWAAPVLGDLGADVIKVERPGTGDDARLFGPAWLTDAEGNRTEESSFFISANRNKRSITVDFAKPEGQEIIRALAERSDVLIENYLPGALGRVGLDYEHLHAVNPRLIYCSVTGYGQTGSYSGRPGYDAIFQAQGGLMSVTGLPDDEPGGGPIRVGPSLVDVCAGYNAAIAILAALRDRDGRSGLGQKIDIALMDVSVAMQCHAMQGYLLDGIVPERKGNLGNGGHPANVFRCADGDIYFVAGTDRHHRDLCRILGLPDMANDPRFLNGPLRFINRQAWDLEAVPLITQWTRTDLECALLAAGIPCSPVNNYADTMGGDYTRERGLTVTVENPLDSTECIEVVASPLRMSANPVRYARPPRLGEHTNQVLRDELGCSDEKIAQLREIGVL
jgi:crotonobetainyl-CoA:carnitine CoA-transferase CaiB-like acyl-CoA transferase